MSDGCEGGGVTCDAWIAACVTVAAASTAPESHDTTTAAACHIPHGLPLLVDVGAALQQQAHALNVLLCSSNREIVALMGGI